MHVVSIMDDDPTSTVGDLAAADFIDGEDIVLEREGMDVEGHACILRGIMMGEYSLDASAFAVYESGAAYVTLQPHNWPETHKLYHRCDVHGVTIEDTTATDYHSAIINPITIEAWQKNIAIKLKKGTNWVNTGDSRWKSSVAGASNLHVMLVYQYGQAIPAPSPHFPVVEITKNGGTDLVADTWGTVVNEKLDDDGLDPNARYRILYGFCKSETAAQATGGCSLGWRARAKGGSSDTFVGGLGPGNNYGDGVRTYFLEDSITFDGDAQVHIEALGDIANKPEVTIGFQQIGGDSTVPTSKSTGKRRSGANLLSRGGGGGIFGRR